MENKDYTIGELKELSKNCFNRTEFKAKYYSAYKYALKNKILDELFEKNKVKSRRWSYENCANESKKYKYFDEFRINSPSAYTTACHNGWLNDFTWLIRRRKAPNHWTKEMCYIEAKKYNKLSDFISNSFVVYSKSIKKGWFKDYTWLESNPCVKEEILTYDVCYNEAKKYEYLCEFREKANSIYSKSIKKGWIKDFSWLKKNHSFLEAFFEKNLIKNNIKYEFQKTFPWLKLDGHQYLDFYLPEYNLAIECQGRQHFDNSNNSGFGEEYKLIIKRDENKYNLCKEHGIKLIYYSLVEYETKYKVYNDIKKLFSTELGLDLVYYNYEEIITIENKTTRAKEHKKEKYKVGCDIIQRTLDGKEIKRWKNIDDICNFYKCTHSCILQAIRGSNHTAKGFIWECDLKTGKYVYEIDENGNILNKFNNPEEASRFYKLCNVSIRERCDKKNLKPFKGHIFTYYPEDFNKDEFLKIDKTEQNPKGYWTEERCYHEAKKYKTFREFQKACSSACTKAYKMGWLEKWGLFKTYNKITFERCVKEASEYKRIEDFKNEKPHLYAAMLNNGWVRMIFKYEGRKLALCKVN